MKSRVPYPLIRLFFPFTAGILLALNVGHPRHFPWVVFPALLLLWGAYVFYVARKISYSTRWIFGVFLYVFMIMCGYELTLLRTPAMAKNHFMHQVPQPNQMMLRILSPPQARERSIRVEAEVVACGDTNGMRPVSGRLMLYFIQDSSAFQLAYGDLVVTGLRPEPIPPPSNPAAFNYKQYMAFRGVYHQGFLRKNEYRVIGKGATNPLMRFAYAVRGYILNILNQNGLGGQEYAVTSALLVGYTDKLDQDLLTAYSGTGAMHILSVSGMHVGLIYAVLNMLFWFFDRMRYGRVPKAVLLLLFIWAYATLTGLSPSVLRAASMFSIIVIGQAVSRSGDIYNSLAASALILLVVNPYFLMDIGFQLSYIAVLGIVSLQKAITAWWTPRWWLWRQGWSLISVSIAAQLATFPLGLYYFQQFPNYFLLTNIVALPLSSLIIYLALVVLAASMLPWLSVWLAQLLSWMVMALNGSICFLEKLPGAVTRGVYISGLETLLLYLLIVFLLLYLYRIKKWALLMALAMAVLLSSSVLMRSVRRQQQQMIVVYDAGKATAIEFIQQQQQVFLGDSLLLNDARKRDYIRGGWAETCGLSGFTPVSLQAEHPNLLSRSFFQYRRFFQFHNYRIALVKTAEKSNSRLRTDCVVLSGNPDMNVKDVLACYRTQKIVIDASNSKKNCARWKQQCAALGVDCWPVADSGALTIFVEN